MKNKHIAGRLLLCYMGAYHVALGVIMMCSGELTISLLKSLAGMSITGSPELGIIGEIFSCYLIAFGVMILTAAWDPIKYRAMISIAIILIAMRLVQWILFGPKVMEVFSMPSSNYWGSFAIVSFLGTLLAWFRWVIHQELRNG